MSEGSEDRMFIRQRCRAVAKEPQHVAGSVERVRDQTGGDRGTDRMEPIFERSRHTEVSTSTANGPEQIGFFVLACPHHLALGGDEFDGSKIVEGEAILAHQPAQPTTQGEPGDPGARNDPARDRQTVQLGFPVELAPGDAALRPYRAAFGIDVNPFHRRQVDHQSAVDGRAPCHVVTATTNRDFEAQLAREVDGIDHVGDATASGDQRRALVHQTVVDPSRFIVACVRRPQELPGETCRKIPRRPRQRIELSSWGHSSFGPPCLLPPRLHQEQTRIIQPRVNYFHLHCGDEQAAAPHRVARL